MAQRVVQLLLVRAQVLPRGLPGHAGDPQRVLDAHGVPRERRRDGTRRARGRGHRRGLRQLHPVRGVRTALPEHSVHGRLLPVPHPDRRRRQGGPRPGRRQGRPPAGVADLERPHRRTDPRAGARRHRDQPGQRPQLGRWARPPDRRRDRSVRRLRGRLLPHVRAAGRRPDPASGWVRVRTDGRAVVLRRSGRRDGVHRAGAALRPAQPRQLAGHRNPPGPGARSARLHQLHGGLPEVLRGRVRHRGGAGGRAARRAAPRRPDHSEDPDRAHDHLSRSLPAQQAQGGLEGAPRDPAGDPRVDLQRRRPRDAMVLLLRRWRGTPGRETRAHGRDQREPRGRGGCPRRRHPGERLPVVGAPALRGGRGPRHRCRRHPRATRRVARHHRRRQPRRGGGPAGRLR